MSWFVSEPRVYTPPAPMMTTGMPCLYAAASETMFDQPMSSEPDAIADVIVAPFAMLWMLTSKPVSLK
jgi:hypothetical protein